MPSSPEHLSDRCLSFFFYILLNSFQINWYTFSGRGILSQAGFSGGGGSMRGKLCYNTGENLFKGVGVLTEKI